MNLIQQFPDISGKIRARIKINNRNYKAVNPVQPLSYIENEVVSKYYEGEFRRWHLKFLFIIAFTLGILYFTLLKSAWIFNLIAST